MAIGDTIYQFILDYNFANHNLTIIMLTCIAQVSYIMHYAHHLMCVLYNTGSVDVNIEAVSALSNAHQLNTVMALLFMGRYFHEFHEKK